MSVHPLDRRELLNEGFVHGHAEGLESEIRTWISLRRGFVKKKRKKVGVRLSWGEYLHVSIGSVTLLRELRISCK